MLFNSLHFLIFFPIIVFLYFAIPHKYRWILLLAASYYFYMSWNAKYAILLIISTIVDYSAALLMGKTEENATRRKYLFASLAANLGLLFVFKYLNFFSSSLNNILLSFNSPLDIPHLNILLPVGISFYTFQTLSYTIDVYRGKIQPEKHLGIFAVYVSFFPQLVAGPIERAKNLLPQFFVNHEFDYKRVTDGLKIMLWGFFLKMVIADRLAALVNEVYNNIYSYSGLPLLLATYFFAFQIYCDFAGYSFIAIGAAKIMGYNLMDNFRRPYFSQSISEFWKRWHISLSTWFKDYLYIPLGGNRTAKYRWYLNLFIVFLVSGFWHGANWTFIFWGALHGFYLVFSIFTAGLRKKIVEFTGIVKFPKVYKIIKVLITFHLVLIGWIFFRANSLADAFYALSHLFIDFSSGLSAVLPKLSFYQDILLGAAAILFMEFIHLLQERRGMRQFLDSKPLLVRWAVYYLIIFGILLFGVFEETPFIYFQF
ncbi:MAG: MBOAT family O-acyltransferase [Candidatus Falkowbacteria bacterium]